jgi:hypothetical protein
MFLDPEPRLRLAIRLPRLIRQFVHIVHRDADDPAPALLARYQAIDRISPLLDRRSSKTPASPAGVFSLTGTYRSPTARRAPIVRAAS